MQNELLHLHVTLFFYWELALNQIAAYGSLFQCSEQKQVQNDDSANVILLAEDETQAAKNLSFLVHYVDSYGCQKESLY